MSSNIVGYEKITLPINQMNIIGVQFQEVGGQGTIDIQDIVTDGFNEYGSDWIRIYDPVTSRYTIAYWFGTGAGGVYLDDSYDEATKLASGWGDVNQIVIDATLDAGQGIWSQSEQGGKVVVSGEVVSSNTVAVPVNMMTLVANPLPMSVDIQRIGTQGFNEYGSDWIRIYDPATSRYTIAYWFGSEAGGVYQDDSYDETTKLASGWGDVNQIVIDITLNVGQGIWAQAEAGGTLVFPSLPTE